MFYKSHDLKDVGNKRFCCWAFLNLQFSVVTHYHGTLRTVNTDVPAHNIDPCVLFTLQSRLRERCTSERPAVVRSGCGCV